MDDLHTEQIVITDPIGLHARPAVKLTQLCKRFQGQVLLSKDNGANWIDAKSIVRVLGLKVKAGETLLVRAEGIAAREVVKALLTLLEESGKE